MEYQLSNKIKVNKEIKPQTSSTRGWRKGESTGRFNDITEELRVSAGGWCQDSEHVVNLLGAHAARLDTMDTGASPTGSFLYHLQENKIHLLISTNICLGGLS